MIKTLDELPPGYYDEIIKENSVRKYWHYYKFKQMEKEIQPGAKNILDIGCASGTFLSKFLTEFPGIKKTGMDSSERQIDYANRHYSNENTRFIGGKVPEVELTENSFDAVTCSEVIEHLPEKEVALTFEIVWRALKPGGRFIVTTPDYNSYWPFLEILVDLAFKQNYRKLHIQKFNRESLAKLFTRTGFKMKTIKNIVGLSPFIAPFSHALAERIYKNEKSGALLLGVGEKAEISKTSPRFEK